MRALRLLSIYDRALLEDRLIEQVTLEQLGEEQAIDLHSKQEGAGSNNHSIGAVPEVGSIGKCTGVSVPSFGALKSFWYDA